MSSAISEDAILRVLAQHPEGLTTDRVRQVLLSTGSSASVDLIAERLRTLAGTQKVAFKASGRRWVLATSLRPGGASLLGPSPALKEQNR
jgi:hypothetical protein